MLTLVRRRPGLQFSAKRNKSIITAALRWGQLKMGCTPEHMTPPLRSLLSPRVIIPGKQLWGRKEVRKDARGWDPRDLGLHPTSAIDFGEVSVSPCSHLWNGANNSPTHLVCSDSTPSRAGLPLAVCAHVTLSPQSDFGISAIRITSRNPERTGLDRLRVTQLSFSACAVWCPQYVPWPSAQLSVQAIYQEAN